MVIKGRGPGRVDVNQASLHATLFPNSFGNLFARASPFPVKGKRGWLFSTSLIHKSSVLVQISKSLKFMVKKSFLYKNNYSNPASIILAGCGVVMCADNL